MTRTSIVFLTLLLLPAFAGCIEPVENEPEPIDAPSWGLGLTIPPVPLELGAYIEGEAAIESLRARIHAVEPKVRAVCSDAHPPREENNSVDDNRFILSLQILFSTCTTNSDEARQWATQDEASGQHSERYRELNQSAWAAYNATIEAVSSLPTPGSLVDVAVQATLQGQAIYLSHNLNLAGLMYEPYVKGNGTYLNLASSYLNLMNVIDAPKIFNAFVNAWIWDEGTCQVPDFGTLRVEVETLVNNALLAIERHGDSDHAMYVNFPEGALLKGSIPGSQQALEMGWWPRVLVELEYMPWLIRQVEIAGDSAWPTREEALHLVALHRAEVRSIYTEKHLATLQENILENPDWQRFPNAARAALATPALQPRVALTPCV